jgi:hypothetical protein
VAEDFAAQVAQRPFPDGHGMGYPADFAVKSPSLFLSG